MDWKKTFLVINFLHVIRPEIINKEVSLVQHKENEDQFHKLHPQFYKTESGCKAGDTCLFPHHKVEEQPSKKAEKGFQKRKSDDKGAVAIVKTVPQLGSVSQDSEPSELPKSVKYRGNPRHKVWGSIPRVRFKQSTIRQASIREKRTIAWKNTSQDSSSARALRCEIWGHISTRDRRTRAMLRRKGIESCQTYFKLKEKDKPTFYSPAEEGIIPAASSNNPEER